MEPRPPYPAPPQAPHPDKADRPGQGVPYAARGGEGIAKKYFTIGEAAALLQVKPSVLRFWETEFPQISPRKTRKGRRLYTQPDLDLLQAIHELVRVQKYTLQGAREKLAQRVQAQDVVQLARGTLLSLREKLQTLRDAM